MSKISNNKITLNEVTHLLDELRLPISLVFTPVNMESEKKKFLDSDSYNPVFKYRVVANNNDAILEKLLKVNEIVDVEPRLSDFYLELILDKYRTDKLMDAVGKNDQVTSISEEKYGIPSPKLFKNACLAMRYVNNSTNKTYNLLPSEKLKSEKYLSFSEISEIMQKVLDAVGLDKWKIACSMNIAKNGVKVGIKNRTIFLDKNLRKRPTELKKTIVHEIGTHVLRAENGFESGFPALSKANLESYLEIEEGLALYNEEQSNVFTEKDLRKRAMFVWLITIGKDMSFRDLYYVASCMLTKKDAFETVLRVKRGLGDTSKKGIFTKDLVYFKGFRKVRRTLAKNPSFFNMLYAGKISFKQIEWIEEGVVPKPKIVFSKEQFNKIFKEVGL